MTNNDITIKQGHSASSDVNQKAFESYKKAAKHLENAAKYHHEAAKHHLAGNYEKALENSLKAKELYSFANDHQREVSIYHALYN